MARTPRKLGVITGFVLPLAAGGLATAQDVEGPPVGPPAYLPAARDTPTVVSVPDCQTPAAVENAPPARPGFWRRVKHRLHACVLGYPEEFEPTPLGASLYAFGRAQVANGEAAQMVLYRADFLPGAGALSPRGHDQLVKIAGLLQRNFAPLVIERSPDGPGLDQARVAAVLTELGRAGFAIPAERVVVGPPLAVGLGGTQAGIVHANLLGQTLSGGRGSGGAGAAVEGGGGPGFGSAGRSGPAK